MAGWRIPPLLYEEWVWPIICLPLVFAVFAVKYFQKETPPRPRPHPFFARHRRAVCLVSDLVIVCFVLAMVAFLVWVSFRDFFALPTGDVFRRHMELRIAWSSFSSGMVVVSAWGTFLLGMLSVFQSSITTPKRIVLLVLCFVPAAFVVGSFVAAASELDRRVISLSLLACVPSWLVNGPPAVTGQPFLRILWRVMRSLRIVSGDYSESW